MGSISHAVARGRSAEPDGTRLCGSHGSGDGRSGRCGGDGTAHNGRSRGTTTTGGHSQANERDEHSCRPAFGQRAQDERDPAQWKLRGHVVPHVQDDFDQDVTPQDVGVRLGLHRNAATHLPTAVRVDGHPDTATATDAHADARPNADADADTHADADLPADAALSAARRLPLASPGGFSQASVGRGRG